MEPRLGISITRQSQRHLLKRLVFRLSSWLLMNLITVMQLLLLSLVRVVLRLKIWCSLSCISNVAIAAIGKLINDAPVAGYWS